MLSRNPKQATFLLSQPWLLLIFAVTALFLITTCSDGPAGVEKPDPDPEPPVEEPFESISAIDTQITQFMEEFDVNGLSLAITKHGRLVYAKGYGYADVEETILADTTHLFRIASLSKFITAAGIMKLIEESSLDMDDKVFGEDAVLGTDFGQTPYPEYLTDIKLRHLLHQESGGWSNQGSDPAFQVTSLDVNELLSWAIDNRPPDTAPGTEMAYSNLNYMILGRIIEKISGQSYEDFIRQHIFEPVGVENMQMGGGSLEDRLPDEVRYYGPPGRNAYETTGTINRLDSAGGWVGSPIDLMRILVRIDGFDTVPDILEPEMVELLSTPSGLSNYAGGFHINSTSGNWWHSGSLNGTRAWIVRGSAEFNWAILTNTGSTDSEFNNRMNDLIWPAVNNAGTEWTDKDLF